MKTIAVQRGLEQIKNYLDNMGYKTVFYDDINSPVDALIYSQDNASNALVNINQLLSKQYSILTDAATYGTILINAKDKSPDDIVKIIESRLYGPLF